MKGLCEQIDERITAYVDGELDAVEAADVARHVAVCQPCRRTLAHEQAAREALQRCAPHWGDVASPALAIRVHRLLSPSPWRARPWAWGAAAAVATLVVGAGAVTVGGIVRPAPVLAAEVALDHRKCLLTGPAHVGATPADLEPSWREWQGWNLHVPTGAAAGLHVIGYRRCYLTEGSTAHVMYEGEGAQLSLFVMPQDVGAGRRQLEIFGQDAVLWTSGGWTYALVGSATRFDRRTLAGMAASLEHELDGRPHDVRIGAH